jgi:hypothetical protein
MIVTAAPITHADLQVDLEQLWTCLDALLEGLQPTERTTRRGRLSCITPAAIPTHLAWFDENVILKAIAGGGTVPKAEQRTMTSLAELERFEAVRTDGLAHTWQESLNVMQAARQPIRRALAAVTTDADLEQPIWWSLPLSGGWRTLRFALEACSSHTWNHVLELWSLQRGRGAPQLSITSATHRALARYTELMVALFDTQRARRTPPLTAVMEFTGPGGGAWTFHISDGACQVSEEWPGYADVVITQSPETFLRTMVLGTEHQLVAVLSGEIRVQGSIRCAAAFRRLFPRPRDGVVSARGDQRADVSE